MTSLRVELGRARWWHAILAFIQSNGIEAAIFIGIVSSALATLGADLGWPPDPWRTIMAAVPGAVLLVERQMRYKKRSDWHQLYKTKLMGLTRLLRDEHTDTAEVSHQLTALDLQMRSTYPRSFDETPAAPSTT